MPLIDLRSDTITLPTPAMRKAMAAAEVGDDVFGENPTVRKLEELVAQHMGKAAGLLVTSGTMGNLVCQMAHCGRGDEMVLGGQIPYFLLRAGQFRGHWRHSSAHRAQSARRNPSARGYFVGHPH
jgi:threonine aldolase